MSKYLIVFLLLINIVFVCAQEFIKKIYLKKISTGSQMLYNFMMIAGAIPIFMITLTGKITFHLPTLCYAFLYIIAFSLALIFTMKALMTGSMALTVIVLSFALVFPLFAGMAFFGESLSWLGWISIFLLLLAFIMIINPAGEEKKTISIKWIIYVSLATIGNGVGGIIIKFHRTQYPLISSSEFMIIALFGVLTVCLIMLLSEIRKNSRFIESPINYKGTFLATTIYGLITGICNGVANLTSLILIEKIPLMALTLFGKGGIFILTFLVSTFVFKETMTKKQKFGFLCGVLSVILLSI